MDTLIRNIDDSVFRAARALAALEGRTVGEVVTDALREYLASGAAAEDEQHRLAGLAPDPPLLDRSGDSPSADGDGEHPATRVDEVVFLYCI